MDPKLIVPFLALALAGALGAEPRSIPMEPEFWQVGAEEHRFETYLGRPALFLNNGLAIVRDFEMRDGVFEVDISIPSERGFSGVVWRGVDGGNYEEFYLRHHQSGNPDANQYSPVDNGVSSWQLFATPRFAVPVEYVANRWMTLRVVMKDGEGAIYLDSAEPILRVELKRTPVSGFVGLRSNLTGARFSNARVYETREVELPGEAAPAPALPETLIREWRVSSVMSVDDLGTGGLPKGLVDHDGTVLEVEPEGMANFSRLAGPRQALNTILASVVIEADSDQDRRLDFGFSDDVRVYLNGRLLFIGTDRYVSRDYRFLGTIGLYDAVILPLRQGRNTLTLAVSEAFGGWGAGALLEGKTSLRVSPNG